MLHASDPDAEFSYALVEDAARQEIAVDYRAQQLTVFVPSGVARNWAETDQIGIAAEIDLDVAGTLSVLIEKDFACLDRSDAENEDAFPNPLAAHAC